MHTMEAPHAQGHHGASLACLLGVSWTLAPGLQEAAAKYAAVADLPYEWMEVWPSIMSMPGKVGQMQVLASTRSTHKGSNPVSGTVYTRNMRLSASHQALTFPAGTQGTLFPHFMTSPHRSVPDTEKSRSYCRSTCMEGAWRCIMNSSTARQ